MSEGLLALERLRIFPIYQQISSMPQRFRDKESIDNDLSLIERELKALEIIKRDHYLVAECLDKYDSFEKMSKDLGAYCPIKTKEEYDLLKEVLP